MLLKNRTLFSKIPAVSAHESKLSAAVPNFGRGFRLSAFNWSASCQKQKSQAVGGGWLLGCELKIEKIKTKFGFEVEVEIIWNVCVEESCLFNSISLQDVQPGQDCDLGDLRLERN